LGRQFKDGRGLVLSGDSRLAVAALLSHPWGRPYDELTGHLSLFRVHSAPCKKNAAIVPAGGRMSIGDIFLKVVVQDRNLPVKIGASRDDQLYSQAFFAVLIHKLYTTESFR
jgi:hypothetical protein